MHQDISYEMHLKSYFMINCMRCYHKMLFMFSWIQLIFSMVSLTEPLKMFYIPRNPFEGLYSQSIFHGMLHRYLLPGISLTHWGRVMHICVSKQTGIGSDNGLSPGRRQAIIWTNAGILWIGPLGTNFSEIISEIHAFSFKKMHLKVSSAKWRLFCLGLNELTLYVLIF